MFISLRFPFFFSTENRNVSFHNYLQMNTFYFEILRIYFTVNRIFVKYASIFFFSNVFRGNDSKVTLIYQRFSSYHTWPDSYEIVSKTEFEIVFCGWQMKTHPSKCVRLQSIDFTLLLKMLPLLDLKRNELERMIYCIYYH